MDKEVAHVSRTARMVQHTHCISARDGKPIAIQKPAGTGKEFFNYKKFCSIVMIDIVDTDYKFTWVTIGANGAASAVEIYNSCDLKRLLQNNILLVPPHPLSFDNEPVPYHLISDESFALSTQSWSGSWSANGNCCVKNTYSISFCQEHVTSQKMDFVF